MKLILVRHGETEENASGITQGHIDGVLSQQGLDQAERVARRLSREHIDAIYASDLGRVVDTTSRILAYHPGITVTYTYDLREMSKGIYDGQAKDLIQDKISSLGQPYHEIEWEKGESIKRLLERVSAFYERISKDHAEDTVLFVSHGGPISALFLYLEKRPLTFRKEYGVRNTAVSVISVTREGHTIDLFNCIRHLEEE